MPRPPTYDLKTNLKAFHSVEFPLYSQGLPNSLSSTNECPDSATIRPDQPQLFSCARTGKSDQTNCSAIMCNEMNCDDMTRAIFLSHAWMSRQVRHTRKSSHKDRNYSQLKGQRTTCAETAQTARRRETTRSAGAKRDAQQASASGRNSRHILHSA